jgi:hypothetical protein
VNPGRSCVYGRPCARVPPAQVERAIRGLRAAPLLTGGRAQQALDVAAAAGLAAAAGDARLTAGLDLIELNPVLVHEDGATVVDAVVASRGA